MNKKTIYTLIAIISAIFIGAALFHTPIPQDISYHNFSDTRTIWSIPNFWNTVSNLPFIIAGIWGLIDLRNISSDKYLSNFKSGYSVLFIGTILVGFGSSYYHLNPNNDTLIWDRLPMTIAFMSLFSIIIAEFISEKFGTGMLWPAVILGVLSVVYWAITESNQQGDLRAYIIVQFLPMLIIPLVLVAFNSAFTLAQGYWGLLACYLLAKIAEHFDYQIYEALSFISGHSIKHLLAASGLLVLVASYRSRRRYYIPVQ